VAVIACSGGQSPVTDDARSDASSGCRAWALEGVTLERAELLETLPVHTGRSARLMLEWSACAGTIPASVTTGVALEDEVLSIKPRAWTTGDLCDAVELIRRPVTVRFPRPGTWRVPTASGDLVVAVEPAPQVACGANACELDCDCEGGEVCLSASGLVGGFTACVRPCAVDRDCLGDGACISADDGFAQVCERGVPECDVARPCPAGFACAAGRCEPTFVLNGATRHGCACDDECEPGLRCAQAPDGRGRCEALCQSESDGWCQGPHTCGPASVEPGEAICGFVGE
jgi:hypothetical protein